MERNVFWNVFMGLGIPFIGVISGIIFFSKSEIFVFGFPVLYFWVFLWFILTSICISLSWYLFDQHNTEIE